MSTVMDDQELYRLAQAAAVDAVVCLSARMVRLGAPPSLPFIAAVASATAGDLVTDLDQVMPLDGHQARLLVEALASIFLGALVGAATEQNRVFTEILQGLEPSRPPEGPPS